MAIKSFRDLRVWQVAMDLVERIYRLTKVFPRREVYGLTSQLQRAAISIPSNIAEGHTREHRKEYLQHISIAQVSLAESETCLEIARRLGYSSVDQFVPLFEQVASLGRQLYSLRNALMKREADNR
ncbi:MAG: four helix bundle protein [candidate division NC10 bacterium]|nr:four helix bundle protein [candidate division NC10 bacterium]